MEIILAVTQSITLLGILAFFLIREQRRKDNEFIQADMLKDFMEQKSIEQVKFLDSQAKEQIKAAEKLNNAYLKHIANLEKMLVPTPVAAPVLSGPVFPEGIQNEIDEAPRVDEMGFGDDPFAGIPIGQDTNVIFEGDPGIPTDIIDG